MSILPATSSSSSSSSGSHFDLLPVELQETILLHLSRSDPAQFWSMRRVSVRCKILVEDLVRKREEIVRGLCRSGIPTDSFLHAAKHLGHGEEYPWVWNRWTRLNRVGGRGGGDGTTRSSSIIKSRPFFKPSSRTSSSAVVAIVPYGTDAVFVSLDDGQIQLVEISTSEVLLTIANKYPAQRLECLYLHGRPRRRPDGLRIPDTDVVVAVSGNRINTYLLAEDPDPSSSGLKVEYRAVLLGHVDEPIDGISSYGPYLMATTIARRVVWQFTTEAQDPFIVDEDSFPETSMALYGCRPACLWPSPFERGILAMTVACAAGEDYCTIDLEETTLKDADLPYREKDDSGPPFPWIGGQLQSPVRKSLAFTDGLFLFLTEDKFLSVVRLGPKFVAMSRYNTMSTLKSYVTSAHFDMNLLLLGTAKGAVFAYKMVEGKRFDPKDWIWQARAVIASAVTDINVLQKGEKEELLVVFATKEGVFQVLLD